VSAEITTCLLKLTFLQDKVEKAYVYLLKSLQVSHRYDKHLHGLYIVSCLFPFSLFNFEGSEGGFPALTIASKHSIWLSSGYDFLQAITCYIESSISANVLAKIQDSFGDKIPMIATALQPNGALSQYVLEVADPLTDVVMNNLLRMPVEWLYYTKLLISSPSARTQRPLKGIAKMQQQIKNISKSLTRSK
jgi:hypothetical protein